MITKLRGLQQHCEKEEVEVGGGGGREGERHFPKCVKVFVWDFRCLMQLIFYFFIVFGHGSVC